MPKTKTKVIFLQDIPGSARKYEVKEVLSGYFRNHLLPRGLAVIATKEALAELEEKRKTAEEDREARIKENEKKASEIAKLTLELAVKAGEDGQVFSSVTKENIEKALAEKGFEGVSAEVDKPIRELGERKIKVFFKDGISTDLKLKVVPEK